jgi:transposase
MRIALTRVAHVVTSIAPSADDSVTLKIHEDLKQSDLLPSDHWLDAGYVTGKNLVNSSQDFGVETHWPHTCQPQMAGESFSWV